MLSKLFGYIRNINTDLSADIANIRKREYRLNICGGCPKRRTHTTYLWVFKKKHLPQCGVCKCVLSSKVLFEDEQCPLNRW